MTGHAAASGPAVLYRAVTVSAGCMISRRLDPAPAISLHPVAGSLIREDQRVVVNRILEQVGLAPDAFPEATWHANPQTSLPIVVIVLHEFPARSADEAALGATGLSNALLDVLALHRGAAGTPIATACFPISSPGASSSSTSVAAIRGTALPGAFAGEDASAIDADLLASTRDPLLALWAGLARDARAALSVRLR